MIRLKLDLKIESGFLFVNVTSISGWDNDIRCIRMIRVLYLLLVWIILYGFYTHFKRIVELTLLYYPMLHAAAEKYTQVVPLPYKHHLLWTLLSHGILRLIF